MASAVLPMKSPATPVRAAGAHYDQVVLEPLGPPRDLFLRLTFDEMPLGAQILKGIFIVTLGCVAEEVIEPLILW